MSSFFDINEEGARENYWLSSSPEECYVARCRHDYAKEFEGWRRWAPQNLWWQRIEVKGLREGPFDQELGGRKCKVHHAARKVMGAKQLAEAIGYNEQIGYPSGSTIFRERPDDYLYCCSDNLEKEVCRHMANNIGFPKLEARLSTMSSEDF
jgi:hypothetical protein